MKKTNAENIASIVEMMIRMGHAVIPINDRRIGFSQVVPHAEDPNMLTNVASSLVHDAIKHGYCSLARLNKSLEGSTIGPNERYQVIRTFFTMEILIYEEQKQVHLILCGKEKSNP
jgi:hypothetical protein